MVPIKRPRVMNKHGARLTEESRDKDETHSSKTKLRKRNLSDMLGSQWSKEELKQFYKAYRKYGKSWKKVAEEICTKSSDMVQALYNINRAYLSLPEDQGTADAFVAMMTDHYNILERGDDEQNRAMHQKIIPKPPKRICEKLRLDMLMDSNCPGPNSLQTYSTPAYHRPLLKKQYEDIFDGSRPRAVGKRTPRIPVQYLHYANDKDHILLPNKKVLKSDVNCDSDLHGGQVLAGSFQRGDSPEASGVSGRITYNMRCSSELFSENKFHGLDLANDNYIDVGKEVKSLDRSLVSRETNNKCFARDDRQLMSKHSRTYETHPNRKAQRKRKADPGCEYHENNDAREECSDTEGDFSSLEALHTLADLSMDFFKPGTAFELESTGKAELKGNDNFAQKSDVPRFIPMDKESEQSLISAKQEKSLYSDKEYSSKVNQQNCLLETPKIKNSLQPKISKDENYRDPHSCEDQENEVLIEARIPFYIDLGRKEMDSTISTSDCTSKGTYIGRNEISLTRSSPECALNTDLGRIEMDSTGLPSSVSTSYIPTRTNSRRKVGLQKAIVQNELKMSMNIRDDCSNKYSSLVVNKAADIKEKLSHCLSSPLLRRWCMFEWFYSAIDYPWFAKNELVNYLKHVTLSHVDKFRRDEWSTIRSSLGKTRRFSKRFLFEERKKIEQYRESVRTHYAELRSGVKEELPSDLAQPLSVGQQVITRHPKTGDVHNGSILAIDYNHFRVQFNDSDLGIHTVMDVDCMPVNRWEYLPTDHRNQNVMVEELCNNYTDGNYFGGSTKYPSSTMIKHKKETLVTEKVHMNDDIFGEKDRCLIGNFEQFNKQYATVKSDLLSLRQYNSCTAMRISYSEHLTSHEPLDYFSTCGLNQNVGSRVAEIVETSRQKAKIMVALTLQEMTSLERREDALANIREDSDSYMHSGVNPRTSDSPHTQLKSSCTFRQQIAQASSHEVNLSSEAEGQVPWELISDCVASCLMIQACSKGQHPPAEVAEILEHMAASLQPCCPDNLPIFREIETIVDYIKIQMLALVPTR